MVECVGSGVGLGGIGGVVALTSCGKRGIMQTGEVYG